MYNSVSLFLYRSWRQGLCLLFYHSVFCLLIRFDGIISCPESQGRC